MITNLLTSLLGRLPIGWLQLKHNRTRMIAAVGGVTFANILIFMQLGFMSALFETSVLCQRSWDADVLIMSSDFRSLREANRFPRARMYQARAINGIKSTELIYISTIKWTNPDTDDTTNFRVLGVNTDADIFIDEVLQSQIKRLRVPDTAIVDRLTRDFPKQIESVIEETGSQKIEVAGRTIGLIGMFTQGASFDVDGTIVVSEQTFFGLFPRDEAGTPSCVLIRCEDGFDHSQIAESINRILPEGDARAFTKSGMIKAEQDYQASQTPIGFVFSFGVVIGLIVGLVVVYQVLTTDVQDHLAEYATFKAIGYSQSFFLGIVFEEAICLAALGFVPGLIVSLLMYSGAASATALPITMTFARLVLVFVLTVAMCLISGMIATRKLAGADPADLF